MSDQELILKYLETIHDDVKEVKADVKLQNGRVRKLEDKQLVMETQDTVARDSKARWLGLAGLMYPAFEVVKSFFSGV